MYADMKNIRRRIKSIGTTMQMTSAMELAAASRLQRAKEEYLCAKKYSEAFADSVSAAAAADKGFFERYVLRPPRSRGLTAVIAADRGLAGGFNINLLRKAEQTVSGYDDTDIIAVGTKAAEHFKRSGRTPIFSCTFAEAEAGKASPIADIIFDGFCGGGYERVSIIYTEYISSISQLPVCFHLLPIKPSDQSSQPSLPIYEPSEAEVFKKLLYGYILAVFGGCLKQSRFCELTARRNAMENAAENARELIKELSLSYNRARQAYVTQEITEIVNGS